MGKAYTKKNGQKGVWLSPADKATRAFRRIKKGGLTPTQLSYHSGYIAAHQDHTDVFLLKQGEKEKVQARQRKRASYRRNKKN